MRQINEQTPKSHKKIMDKYCQERWSREYHAQEKERHNADLKKWEEAYEIFKLTGTVSKEYGEELFSTYKSLITANNSICDWSDSISEDSFFKNEQELKNKGYDVDEVYEIYQKDSYAFSDY